MTTPQDDFPLASDPKRIFVFDEVYPFRAAQEQAEKKKLGFAVYSVQIDVGQSSRDTLAALSDRVTSVSALTDDAARDLFLKM